MIDNGLFLKSKKSYTDDSGKVVDYQQLENLHAFLLAIDEINKRKDILPDHHVEYVIRTPVSTSFVSIGTSSLDLINHKVLGVVGSLDNFGMDSCSRYFAEYGIVQSQSMAMDTGFGVGISYPFKISTVPIDSFQGIHALRFSNTSRHYLFFNI